MKRALLVGAVLIAEPLRLVYFSRLGLSTDWLLGVAILATLITRAPRGAVIGFTLGAIRDVIGGQPIGFEAMMFCALAWIIGSAGRTVYREAFPTQVLMILGATLVHGVAIYLSVVGTLQGVLLYLIKTVFLGALLPAVVIPLVYHALKYVTRPRFSDELEALLRESQPGRPRGTRS